MSHSVPKVKDHNLLLTFSIPSRLSFISLLMFSLRNNRRGVAGNAKGRGTTATRAEPNGETNVRGKTTAPTPNGAYDGSGVKTSGVPSAKCEGNENVLMSRRMAVP